MKFGIEFTYKDGSKDWYDPVTEDDIEDTDTEIILHLIYDYSIPKANIASQRRYELCPECRSESGTCCCDKQEADND